jgi:hypothetical protein
MIRHLFILIGTAAGPTSCSLPKFFWPSWCCLFVGRPACTITQPTPGARTGVARGPSTNLAVAGRPGHVRRVMQHLHQYPVVAVGRTSSTPHGLGQLNGSTVERIL